MDRSVDGRNAKWAEAKIGIAHEGWGEASEDQCGVKAKTVYSHIIDGDRFWEGITHKDKRMDNQSPNKEISKQKAWPGMKAADRLEDDLPALSGRRGNP